MGVRLRLLDEWRARATGPAYQRIGQRVLYRIAQLEAYIQQHNLLHAPRQQPERDLNALPCPDRCYSVRETCALLHVSARTLLYWRKRGTGPAWERHGRQIRYDGRVLLAYLHAPGAHHGRRHGR